MRRILYLNQALVTFRSSTQKMVSLWTTEADYATVMGMQDALFVWNIGFKVEGSMLANIDNGGAVDIENDV